jgi:hypothetical protein
LKKGGVFYFLIIEDNSPEEVREVVEDVGFTFELLTMRKF